MICLHKVLQQDSGANLIYKAFIFSSLLLLYTGSENGLMGQNRRKPLVIIDNGDCRNGFPPSVNESFYAAKVLAGRAIGLCGLAYNNLFHFLTGCIVCEELEQISCGNGFQSTGNNLQWVGNSQSGTLAPVIYSQYARHLLGVKQPSVRILST